MSLISGNRTWSTETEMGQVPNASDASHYLQSSLREKLLKLGGSLKVPMSTRFIIRGDINLLRAAGGDAKKKEDEKKADEKKEDDKNDRDD